MVVSTTGYSRSRRRRTLIVLVSLAAGGSAVGCRSTPTPATGSSPTAPRCSRSVLALSGPLEGFGGVTGEHQLTYAVQNTGAACSLEGYPTVRLFDPGPMPFVYDDKHPFGPFLSMAPPREVVIAAHGSAYFEVVKYRCDAGDGSFATSIQVTLPDAGGSFVEKLAPPDRSLSTCVGQVDDPGNVVSVSPIRATARELTP
jgi:hypothetical protein